MADGRKNNGGNSTKAKGVDKRKNAYKTALAEASSVDDVIKVILNLKQKALGDDIQAIKLYLAYYLGNPKETIETSHTLNDFDIKSIFKVDKDK